MANITFVITKGPTSLKLFWGPDGWQANSHHAIKYPSEAAAKKALKVLEVKPGETVWIEDHIADYGDGSEIPWSERS